MNTPAVDHFIPDFCLDSGKRVPRLRVRYTTHGSLNSDKSNAVLFPTWFGATHSANEWIIGPGRSLDTQRYFVIVVNALGNGESSSPSNDEALREADQPVEISLVDNVRAQLDLVQHLGIGRLHAVIGRSMGAQQALQWGCLYPDRMGRIIAFCGTPRTTSHNQLLLDAMDEAINSQAAAGADLQPGLRRAARIYAGWVLSHDFFNEGLWRTFGDATPAHWIARVFENAFLNFHPLNLLALVRTWRNADVSRNRHFNGGLKAALQSIEVPVLLIPISDDLIFRPADIENFAKLIPRVEIKTITSKWGHRAGAPGSDSADVDKLETMVSEFLNKPDHQ